MSQTGSLPYILLLGAIGFVVAVFLWVVLDAAVAEIVVTDTWTSGSEHTERGRGHVLAMWDYALAFVVTSITLSILIASRRGQV